MEGKRDRERESEGKVRKATHTARTHEVIPGYTKREKKLSNSMVRPLSNCQFVDDLSSCYALGRDIDTKRENRKGLTHFSCQESL